MIGPLRVRPRSWPSPETTVTWLVLAAAVAFVFVQLQPSLLFAHTTPAGGDMGAHVWGPAYMRDHLLPKGRITGWAPDWYAGFPAYTFYFPLPSLVIALLSYVIPYVVAFKLVTVLGLLSLPVCAYAFGRMAGLRFPGPVVLGLATVPFLLDRGFTIYGGNIASTLAGEFSFSISLSLALLFLGVVARGLETGRRRVLAGVLLALTGLSHVLPTLFALAGAVVLLALRWSRRRAWYTACVLGLGGLLAAFWVVPAYVRGTGYSNNMGWGRATEFVACLFPTGAKCAGQAIPDHRWLVVLAVVGAVCSVFLRRRAGLAILGLGVAFAAIFCLAPAAPPSRLWNARFLPFWYLCLYLLGGLALAETGSALGRLRPQRVAAGMDDGAIDAADRPEPTAATAEQDVEAANPGLVAGGVPAPAPGPVIADGPVPAPGPVEAPGPVNAPAVAPGAGGVTDLRRSPVAMAVWALVGVPIALASVPFALDRSFGPYRTATSQLAGGWAFPIGVALATIGVWVLARGLVTGRDRALAAILLGASGVFAVGPTALAVVAALQVFLLRRASPGEQRPSFRHLLSGLWPALVLVALWLLPSPLGLVNTTATPTVSFQGSLFAPELRWWLLPLAAGGAFLALAFGRREGVLLVLATAGVGLLVRLLPEGRLLNGRLLPFWYLGLLILAGLALAEFAAAAGRLAPEVLPRARLADLATPVAGALAVWLLVGLPLGVLPGPLASWLSTGASRDSNFVPSWAAWNYSGYERKPAWPEYRAIMTTMARVGRTHGCGRAHWEYEENINRFGTPLALMLLPYWTKGCIGSMEGLYFESSATTPFHFLSAAELSKAPSDPQRDLPYRSLDVAAGVRHLQLLGVRYYLAFSPDAVKQAMSNPDLRQVDQTGSWKVFEVEGSELVKPLDYQPAVLTGVGGGARPWLDAAVNWYQDPSAWDVFLAAGGPSAWPRVAVRSRHTAVKTIGTGVTVDQAPKRPVAPATVTHIRSGDDSLSFDVDRPGSPVLVKVSYFPNWQASGAKGPWRVAPNLMVVVPTSRHVSLHYGGTPVDAVGLVLSLAGLGLAVVLARRPALEYERPPREPLERHQEPVPAVDEPAPDPITVAAGREPDS